MTHPAKGDPAPDFTLPTDAGGPFTLSEHRGHPVVLFFYPKDDTPGCTIENIEFSAEAERFADLGVTLVGISPDSAEDHVRFRKKHDLRAILAADPERRVIEAYGFWGEKKNYGKTYMGVIRGSILVDADGLVAEVWVVRQAKGHAAEVLEAAEALTRKPA
jgi:thioredoxin-dependent peroxiredoxin